MPTWNKLLPPAYWHDTYFFYTGIQDLVPWWDTCLNVTCDHVKWLWCVPLINRSQTNFWPPKIYLIFQSSPPLSLSLSLTHTHTHTHTHVRNFVDRIFCFTRCTFCKHLTEPYVKEIKTSNLRYNKKRIRPSKNDVYLNDTDVKMQFLLIRERGPCLL